MSRHLPVSKLKCHVMSRHLPRDKLTKMSCRDILESVWVKMGDLGETSVRFWRDLMEIIKNFLQIGCLE